MKQAPQKEGETPRPSAADIRRALAMELSIRARIGHTLLLLSSFSVAAVVAALLLTEPSLPPATQAAFAAITVAGLSWTAFAGWVLARRRVLYATHRIVAARMAVGFSALFALGALLLGPRGLPGWYAAVVVGVAMFGVAVALLIRAHRRFRQLSAQRAQLELELARHGGSGR